MVIAVADKRKRSVALRPRLAVTLLEYHCLSFACISPISACSWQVKPKFCLTELFAEEARALLCDPLKYFGVVDD